MGNSPKARAGSMRRTAIGALLATLLLTASSVSAGDTSIAPGDKWLSGCPDTMVIANVDCGAGPLVQKDEHQRIDVADVEASVLVELAPWCDGRTDISRYGCPVISTQSSVSTLVTELRLLLDGNLPAPFTPIG